MPPILPPQDGFLFLDREKFHDSFAGDVSAEQAAFMADSQVPWGVDALGGTISEAGVAEQAELVPGHHRGRMIPPPAQREMSGRAGATVEEAAASHSRSTCRSRRLWLTSSRRLPAGGISPRLSPAQDAGTFFAQLLRPPAPCCAGAASTSGQARVLRPQSGLTQSCSGRSTLARRSGAARPSPRRSGRAASGCRRRRGRSRCGSPCAPSRWSSSMRERAASIGSTSGVHLPGSAPGCRRSPSNTCACGSGSRRARPPWPRGSE